MSLKCVLWDFGGTLADETWMLDAPPGLPAWREAWSGIAGRELADDWNLGRIRGAEVGARVAARLGIGADEVAAHVRSCCARIRFSATPLAVARRSRLRQALVTVNPDGFSEHVVPVHRLDALFRPIVTSWQEGTLDKGALCRVALERLGASVAPGEALLIDDKSANVDAWRERGGRGYWFRGESQFRRDLAGPLRDLAGSAGMA